MLGTVRHVAENGKPKRVLVTGAAGQLGYDVCRSLDSRRIENRGVDLNDFDLRDSDAVMQYIRGYNPTHVVHCGAYTAVDKAESEKELCLEINGEGTANVARACRETGAEMMYFSTDYVFDGFTKLTPWEVSDPPDPLSVYGISKYRGEYAIREQLERFYVLRISWVFGRNGSNFVKTMLRLAETNRELTVVCDQYGAPTYTKDVAELVPKMLESGRYGTYHCPNEGMTSWYDFAQEIMRACGKDVKVHPILTEEYPAAATRPKNSRMSTESIREAGFGVLPHYHDALMRYLRECGLVR